MLEFNKVTSDILVSTLLKVALRLRGLIFIPLITIYLGIDSYGVYVQVIALASISAAIFDLGLHAALVQFAQKKEDIAVLYYTAIFFALCSSIIPLAGIYLFATSLSEILLSSPLYSIAFQVGAVLVPIRIWNNMLRNYYRSQSRIKTFSLIQAAQTYISTGAVVTAVALFEVEIQGVLITVVIFELFFTIVIQLIVMKKIGLVLPKITKVRSYLRYSLPLMISIISSNLSSRADRFIIGSILGPAAVGVYDVAYQLATTILLYVTPIRDTYFPELSQLLQRDNYETSRRYIQNGTRYFLLVSIPSVVGMFLIGPDVASIIATPEVGSQIILLLPILAAGIVLWGLDEIYGVILVSSGNTKKISIVRGGAAITNIILNVILVPEFGIEGAAVATLATYGLSAFGVYTFSYRVLETKFAYRTLLNTAIGSGCILLVGVLLDNLQFLLIIPICVVIYVAIIFIIGELSIEEIKSVATKSNK